MIDRELSLANLVSQLGNSNLQLQLNALVLINNLLQYASPQRKPNMVSTLLVSSDLGALKQVVMSR